MSNAEKLPPVAPDEAPEYHADLRGLTRRADTREHRWLTIMTFVGLGPVIGGLVFFMPILWHMAPKLVAEFPVSFDAAPKSIVIVLIGSYVIGGIPALLAGAGVFTVRRILPRHTLGRAVVFGLTGALATGAFVAILHYVFQETRDDGSVVITPIFSDLREFLILTATCIVPTLVCGYIVSRAGWLTPPMPKVSQQ